MYKSSKTTLDDVKRQSPYEIAANVVQSVLRDDRRAGELKHGVVREDKKQVIAAQYRRSDAAPNRVPDAGDRNGYRGGNQRQDVPRGGENRNGGGRGARNNKQRHNRQHKNRSLLNLSKIDAELRVTGVIDAIVDKLEERRDQVAEPIVQTNPQADEIPICLCMLARAVRSVAEDEAAAVAMRAERFNPIWRGLKMENSKLADLLDPTHCEVLESIQEEYDELTMPQISFAVDKRIWWKPWHKRSYDSSKLINRDHEGMTTERIHDANINVKLYTYLRAQQQPGYKDREQALAHADKLRKKYYEVAKVAVPDMDISQLNCDLLTQARSVDQRDNKYLSQPTDIYKRRGIRNAISGVFRPTEKQRDGAAKQGFHQALTALLHDSQANLNATSRKLMVERDEPRMPLLLSIKKESATTRVFCHQLLSGKMQNL